MNFITENWMLILTALTSGGLLLWPVLTGRTGGAGAVSPAEAVRMINRDKAMVIDVREPAEYQSSHVSGARNVPLAQLDASKQLPTNKALPLIVVCANGARATRATATLRKLGYENARALAGGMAAWREANLPIEK